MRRPLITVFPLSRAKCDAGHTTFCFAWSAACEPRRKPDITGQTVGWGVYGHLALRHYGIRLGASPSRGGWTTEQPGSPRYQPAPTRWKHPAPVGRPVGSAANSIAARAFP